MKLILIVAGLLGAGALFVTNLHVSPKIEQQKTKAIAPKDSIIEITISTVGDLMCHSTIYNYAKTGQDTFNFNPCFDFVRPYLVEPDLLIGNLETTLGGNDIPYSGYPRFNSPDAYIDAIKAAGFDFLITANNHANDTDEKGIRRTIGVLDAKQVNHTGTFTSQVDRDSLRIQNIKGINVAIIAYTFSTNGIDIPQDKPYLINYCDSDLIKKDILQSRNIGADLVLVFFHFGEEYQRMPVTYQTNFVNWTIASGADIIIGSHPHVIEPATYYKAVNAKVDTGFVIYSLGNFLSNQKDEFTDEGMILNMHITKTLPENKIRIAKVDYVPTWVYRGTHEEKKLHIIFPVQVASDSSVTSYLTKADHDEMKKALEHTQDIMSKMSSVIKPIGY